MMKFDDKNFIAEKIRSHRKKLNMTQSELAEKADLSDQHISRIESGCYIPSLKSFFLIVNALNIDLREFGFDETKTDNLTKNKLINIIINAGDYELAFYENIINAINTSLAATKR